MYSARPALADPLRHEAENQSRLTPDILLLGFHPRCASLVQLFISVDAISQKNPRAWRSGEPASTMLTTRGHGVLHVLPFSHGWVSWSGSSPCLLGVSGLPGFWSLGSALRHRGRREMGHEESEENLSTPCSVKSCREVSPGSGRCCPWLGALRHRASPCRGA